VTLTVQPEFEASLEFSRQALLHLDIPMACIQKYTDAVRQEHYAPLYQNDIPYRTIAQLLNAAHLLELAWVDLKPDSPMIGQTIKELNIRTRTGASVVGAVRGEAIHPNPGPDFRFADGDWVGAMGDPQHLASFQELAAPAAARCTMVPGSADS
jgi:CPA2 family monovalent cation:H+ antiporter-2